MHWWVLYALATLAASAAATWGLPTWFSGTDADWLAWVAGQGAAEAPAGLASRPVASTLWRAAYGLFGWNYRPYQFLHVLLWLAAAGMFAAMLERLWGRRRPAVFAAAVAGAMLIGSMEEILRLAYLPLACELLLGFASVALAATGWRRRRWPLVAAGWVLLGGACCGSPASLAYLPALHVAAIAVGWRRRVAPAWLAVGLLGVAAVTTACLPTFGPVVRTWTFAEVAYRWRVHRQAAWGVPAGAILSVLAAVAGMAQALRLQWTAWPMIAGLGAAMAVAALAVDPLAAVLILVVLSPRGWPFALWAAAQLAVELVDTASLSSAPMLAGFACAPVMVVAVWRSPLAVWVSRFLRRLDPKGRRLIYSGAALAAVLLAAHSDQWVDKQLRVLSLQGRRRRMHAHIVPMLAESASKGARVIVVTCADMGIDAWTVEASPPLTRAEVVRSFTPDQYAALLAARGRDDVKVISLASPRLGGEWLAATSRKEKHAARQKLGELGPALLDLSDAKVIGGLWRPPSPPPSVPSTLPSSSP